MPRKRTAAPAAHKGGGDKLATYAAKRDFAKTAEPAGGAPTPHGNSFMVQKHAATRLHWDFRLELDGVLLSWAVTKPPSTDPAVKRLAVRTEDHPLDYATFEGTIPRGEYGGGTVMLWDRGTWTNEIDPHEGMKKGKLHFMLTGERMKGEWVLIRLKPEGNHENWLLGKIADEYATGVDLDFDASIVSGRTMAAIAAGEPDLAQATLAEPVIPDDGKKGARGTKPSFREPQLATLVDRPPTGNDWLHETKYDGYRALVAVGDGNAVAYSRSGLDWTARFGGIPAACAALPCRSALLDGEIVALDGTGKPNFSTLQATLKDGGPLLYFVFDLLNLDGVDLADIPLTERKARLAALLDGAPAPLHYSEHVRGGGEAMYTALCVAGYEGVVSKRADGKSRPGRSGSWLKAKCTHRQEFVIGGWSKSNKGRGFASLLLGVQEEGGLRYAGRVGTGFDDRTLADLTDRLATLKADHSPFAGKLDAAARRGATFVRAELVAEVAFAEFTADGSVRHASFLGLREDKVANDVVAEMAAAPPGKRHFRQSGEDENQGGSETTRTGDAQPAPAPDRHGVRVTSPDRVVFPELGLTKAALVDYYAVVADVMLRELASRPISLVRCPQGRAKTCFFQKHDSGMFSADVHHVDIAESNGATEPYLYVDNAEGLLNCVQMGTIEFHGWGSRVADIERPDRLVIDLDPDEGLDFAVVKTAALVVRDRLQARGLNSFPMLTGGKGVHIVAPLVPDAEWPAVKAWAHAFAQSLETEMPTAFVSNMSKAKRKGRIFVDWLRNQRGATAVLPYSVRARAGAGVAVPITWTQLADTVAGNAYTAADPAAVLAQAARPAEPAKAVKLPA